MIDAAANRYYYAVFQAVFGYAIAHVSGVTLEMPDRSKHKIAKATIEGTQGINFVKCFKLLQGHRIIADYKLEPVQEQRLREVLVRADNIRQYHVNAC